jgi:septum formation protein
MKRIILASASPRRKELLERIGLIFEIIPSGAEEVITSQLPSEVVEELSRQKAEDVAGQVTEGIVIGADTVVCQDGRIMGKPKDRQDAWEMLRSLQGNTHSVFTGVTVFVRQKDRTQAHTFSCETKVHVYPMTEQETEAYLNTGEPMDKAGAYGIQGYFSAWVESIEGDYNNVVGLPVSALWQVLKQYV